MQKTLHAAVCTVTWALLPLAAQAQMGPDYWQVIGVTSSDHLTIRSGPATSNRVVATALNDDIFRNLGCQGEGNARWCNIETPDGCISGWVPGRFLQESGAPPYGNAASQTAVTAIPGLLGLHERQTGEIEVRFAEGCTVLYNPAGRVITAGSSCSVAQRNSAQNAIEAYRREQANSADHCGGGEPTLEEIEMPGTRRCN